MKRSRAAGFSILEVLLSVVILGVGLLGIVDAVAAALRAQKDAELISAAALLAAGNVEELRAESYLLEGEEEGEFTGGSGADYVWKRVIRSTEIDGLYEVEVAVQLSGGEKTLYELRTLLFETPYQSEAGAATLDPGRGGRADRRRRKDL